MSLLHTQYAPDQVLRLGSAQDLELLSAAMTKGSPPLRLLTGHIGFEVEGKLPFPVHYITFLREPLARVISAYQYIRANPAHTHHARVVSNNMSLEDYIRARVSSINIDNGMTRLLSGEPNAARDVEFGQCTAEMLRTAKSNLQNKVAVVGLTEQFDASLVLMRQRFKWQTIVYKALNSTSGKGTSHPHSAELMALIAAHNELDLELYAFGKKLFQRQMLRALPWLPIQLRKFRNQNLRHSQASNKPKQVERVASKRITRWLDSN